MNSSDMVLWSWISGSWGIGYAVLIKPHTFDDRDECLLEKWRKKWQSETAVWRCTCEYATGIPRKIQDRCWMQQGRGQGIAVDRHISSLRNGVAHRMSLGRNPARGVNAGWESGRGKSMGKGPRWDAALAQGRGETALGRARGTEGRSAAPEHSWALAQARGETVVGGRGNL